jgi:SNF2 family DNA or RNA helicase
VYHIDNCFQHLIFSFLSTYLPEYERPISASNNKNCSSEQRRLGLAQSRILDEITQTFMLRRLQKDILKTMLPPRNEVLLFCRPTSQQCKLYKEITTQQGTGLALGPTAGALTTLTNLRKLCSHPALVVEDSASDPSCATNIALSGKLSLLDSLLATIRTKAAQDKVVIVSNYTSALSIIENSILKPRGLTYVRLDGTTELSKRQGIVDTFNRTSSQRNFAFLLSSKAGGCGLNLIGGECPIDPCSLLRMPFSSNNLSAPFLLVQLIALSCSILIGMWLLNLFWLSSVLYSHKLVYLDRNPASDIQAMARIYRQGQEKPCTIYRLFTSGTVEEGTSYHSRLVGRNVK